ncbi:MAG: plasmid mobilization relaxosome protein MobC, partial [Lactococcus lactis]|nr:plasmid mobilization relaxosome protein MobC [Lactococcus lactis]
MKDELFLLYLCTQVRSSLKTLTPYFELLELTDICEVDKMKIIEVLLQSLKIKYKVYNPSCS